MLTRSQKKRKPTDLLDQLKSYDNGDGISFSRDIEDIILLASTPVRPPPKKVSKQESLSDAVFGQSTSLLFDDSVSNVSKDDSIITLCRDDKVVLAHEENDSVIVIADSLPRSAKRESQQLGSGESGGESGNIVKVLQRKFAQGLEAASQAVITQVTQNTQAIQEQRLLDIVKDVDVKKMVANGGISPDEGPFYGLPLAVRDTVFKVKGITKLYDWQDECLRSRSLSQRQNLIYSAPTSGGKTLVAEVLMLKELLVRQKDCMFVLPYVSLVQEKVNAMSELAISLNFIVEEYAGGKGSYPPKQRRSKRCIYVATIEKASGLVNSLIDCRRIDSLGLCVIDELHMIGEAGGRGALLEMSISKLRLAAKHVQIVGMSATISNMNDLSRFTSADLYINDFRPVKLSEYVKLGDDIYEVNRSPTAAEDEKLKHLRKLSYNYDSMMKIQDPDYLAGLLLEVIPKYSCLVFCATKKNCESVAQLVCSLMPRAMKEVNEKGRKLLAQELQETCGQLCPVLARTVLYGVAYHHSGLTFDERKLIEEAYATGTLCCLICTSTLAAGVNLPARRVIIRSPYVGISKLQASQYKQMIGRAGRAGIDSYGESILIVQAKDRPIVEDLLFSPFPSCQSTLDQQEGLHMRRFLMNLIGSKLCTDVEAIYSALLCTLFGTQASSEAQLCKAADSALASLSDMKVIVQKQNADGSARLELTEIGNAAYKGSIDANISGDLYEDLCHAQQALCLQSYLHLIYLITPYDLVQEINPDWSLLFSLHGKLSTENMNVANTVGVTEKFLHKKSMGSTRTDKKSENIHRRFFVALILFDLYNERPVWEVSHKYMVNRGLVQNMLQTAISFANCVYYFSLELPEFWSYQALFEKFIKKFSLCSTPELNSLMELPGIKIGRAMQLSKAGFKTLQQLAYCDPSDLVTKIVYLSRTQANRLKSSALMLIQEKADSLRAEADAVIALPTPIPHVDI